MTRHVSLSLVQWRESDGADRGQSPERESRPTWNDTVPPRNVAHLRAHPVRPGGRSPWSVSSERKAPWRVLSANSPLVLGEKALVTADAYALR
jgi:hypothetical protein